MRLQVPRCYQAECNYLGRTSKPRDSQQGSRVFNWFNLRCKSKFRAIAIDRQLTYYSMPHIIKDTGCYAGKWLVSSLSSPPLSRHRIVKISGETFKRIG